MFKLEMRINRERAGPQESISHPGSHLPPALAPFFAELGVFLPPPEQEIEADAELEERLTHLQISRVKPAPLPASWERCVLSEGSANAHNEARTTMALTSDNGLMERSLLRPHVPMSLQLWEVSIGTAWVCRGEGLLSYH